MGAADPQVLPRADAEAAAQGGCMSTEQPTPEQEVLLAANERFLDYMRERHYPNEEAVLHDVQGHTASGALIRAVAKWRISKRESP
jgi:hypothetical protein